jgi:hypothetical protein
MGPILEMVVVSRAVIAGTMCEESGRHANIGLLHLVGLLWIQVNFGGNKKNDFPPHSKIPPFFLQNTFNPKETLLCLI